MSDLEARVCAILDVMVTATVSEMDKVINSSEPSRPEPPSATESEPESSDQKVMQFSLLMASLAQDAVEKICQLFEDCSSALRLEVSQGAAEIEDLRRRLRGVEMDLRLMMEGGAELGGQEEVTEEQSEERREEGEGSPGSSFKVVVAGETRVKRSPVIHLWKNRSYETSTTTFKEGTFPELIQQAEDTYQCPLCHKVGPYHALTPHLQSHQKSVVKYKEYIVYKCHLRCVPSSHYHCSFCQRVIIRKELFFNHFKSHLTAGTAGAVTAAAPTAPAGPPPATAGTIRRSSAAPATAPKTLPSKCVKTTCRFCHLVLQKKNLKVHIQRQHSSKTRDVSASRPLQPVRIDNKRVILAIVPSFSHAATTKHGQNKTQVRVPRRTPARVLQDETETALQTSTTTFKEGTFPKLIQQAEDTYQCPLCHKVGPYHALTPHLQSHQKSVVKYKEYIVYKCHLRCVPSSHYHCSFCQRVIIRKELFFNHFKSHLTAGTTGAVTAAPPLMPAGRPPTVSAGPALAIVVTKKMVPAVPVTASETLLSDT